MDLLNPDLWHELTFWLWIAVLVLIVMVTALRGLAVFGRLSRAEERDDWMARHMEDTTATTARRLGR